jgi:NADPH-dependent curcumin reductase CurA
MTSATQIRLKRRPEGLPQDDVWEKTEDAPREPGDGEITVEVQYVSIDPAMRGWINDTRSYIPPVGSVVGQIAKIKDCRVVGIAGGKEKRDTVVEK